MARSLSGAAELAGPSTSRGSALPPASGAWREGDHPGGRKFADLGGLDLERGGRVESVRLAYETWGTLSASRDNAVLVEHALTGDAHVVGEAGPGHATAGWWGQLIGPGRPLDTDKWFVIAANVLGGCQGSTGPSSTGPSSTGPSSPGPSSPGPSSPDPATLTTQARPQARPGRPGTPYGSRFPYLTVRDQVAAEVLLADHLDLPRWALVVGGSMGGMRALEWAVMEPDRVERLFVLASTAAASGDQIAWCAAQTAAIRADPGFNGGDYYDAPDGQGPHLGLGVARRIAHVTYRSGQEVNLRFGRRPQSGEDPLGGGGRFAVESYLDHHADKLVRRFDANSYVVLTEGMNSHDVGRGRGGVANALSRVTARTAVAAIDSDRLYPPDQNAEIAAGVRTCSDLRLISSPYGHDGFLLETDQVGKILTDLL